MGRNDKPELPLEIYPDRPEKFPHVVTGLYSDQAVEKLRFAYSFPPLGIMSLL